MAIKDIGLDSAKVALIGKKAHKSVTYRLENSDNHIEKFVATCKRNGQRQTDVISYLMNKYNELYDYDLKEGVKYV